MGINYLWDTNTAIYYLQQLFSKDAEEFIDSIIKRSSPAISAITEIELLCWKNATDNDIQVLKNFVADSLIFELEQEIKQKTIELRKKYSIKLPDAIIAATALVNNLTLISRNSKDFSKIEDLLLTNPFEL
jgi:predicted nucleic acid-binding protein